MNAPIIQANYHQLARIATIFARHAERSGELHRNLRRQTDALVGSAWQGEAAQRFHAEMDSELLPALRRLAEALDEAKSITWQICDILRTAENEAAALFRTERRETVQYGGGSDGFAAWLEEMSDGLAARLQEASDGLASMLTEVAAVLTGQSDCEGGTR
ncbi:MAG: WXG100 family type VII secretion target, partial [Anaerolineales bacterium]|nr:WXG100 family type VII secretion target [Anaerolineales bacterium]